MNPTWNFETKVIFLFSDPQTPNRLPYLEILQTLSDAALFNVANLQILNDTKCLMTYYNPFSREIGHVWNPKTWLEAFPDKALDIHGHKVKFMAVRKSPDVIFQDDEVFGLDIDLFSLFLREINGTILLSQGPFQREEYDTASALGCMLPNRFPFHKPQLYDLVPANDRDKMRIMVRNRKAQWTSRFLNRRFMSRYVSLNALTFMVMLILHHFLFCRNPRVK